MNMFIVFDRKIMYSMCVVLSWIEYKNKIVCMNIYLFRINSKEKLKCIYFLSYAYSLENAVKICHV